MTWLLAPLGQLKPDAAAGEGEGEGEDEDEDEGTITTAAAWVRSLLYLGGAKLEPLATLLCGSPLATVGWCRS